MQQPMQAVSGARRVDRCSLGLLGRLKDEGLVDVRDNTTASNSGLDESVELLIASNSELQMSGSNSLNLKILGSVAGKLEDLSSQVLEDSSCVDS